MPRSAREEANASLLAEIAELRRSECELRASREHYRQLVERTNEGILSMDAAGRITFLNDRAAEILGRPAAVLVGMSVSDAISEPLGAEMRARLENPGEGISDQFESCLAATDGSPRWFWVSTAPLTEADGKFVGLLAVLFDITERRQAEVLLRQREKIETIGQLAGGIAHEFNNILTVISGYSEMMLSRMDTQDPARSDAEQIRRAADRAASITQQILAFSRRQIIALRPVELNELIAGTESMLKYMLGNQILVATQLRASPSTILADAGQLTQVLVNLALNARDAMPDGGILTFRTECVRLERGALSPAEDVPPGTYALLTITDTGEGIEPGILPRIFDPFFSTKEPGKGSGLGLSAVDGIIRQLGGYVLVESSPRAGARFDLYLPLAPSLDVEAGPAAAAPPRLGTILVVEDDTMVRALAREALEEGGYAVLEAPHGAEALRLSQTRPEPIDLLLTDLVMPGMSGREVADAIARLRPEARMLFMSGHGEDEHRERGSLAEGAPFLRKPFTPQRLLAAVREVLKGGEN